MLARVATRAVRGRGAILAARTAFATPQWSRSYARSDAPHRSAPKAPAYAQEDGARKSAQDVSNRGPVKNETWSPDVGAQLAGEEIEYSSSPATASSTLNNRSSPVPPASSPSPSAHSRSPAEPSPLPASPNAPRRSSKVGGSPASDFKASPESPLGQTPSDAASQTATGPLPDLTKGIPSTFEAEFLNQNKTAAHGEGQRQASLDITESDATEGSSQSGRQGGGGGDGGPRQKEQYVSSIDRRRNAVFRYTFIGAGAFALVGALFLGQNWTDADEEQRHPDVPNGYSAGLLYGRIKARLNEMFGYYTEPAFPQLLPTMDPSQAAPYTLVFSLEDLLVSSKWTPQKGWQVAKRPGVDYFLRYLSQYYELVVFTSVASMNADVVLKKLDPYMVIAFPLFREATRYINGNHVKDLSYLNRDLSKTIVIDTVPAHVQLQPENAVILPKWSGDAKDPHTNDLVALIPFLEYIASMGIEDVRKALKSYEGTHIPTEFAKREARAREAFNKQLAEERRKRGKFGSVTGGLSDMLGFKPGMQVPGEQSLADGLAQGKMLSDQMRERGQRTYLVIDKEIRENGDSWVKQRDEEDKRMIEETTRSMQGTVRGTFGGLFGGGGAGGDKTA